MDDLSYDLEHCRQCGGYLGSESLRAQECLDCYVPISLGQRGYAVKRPKVYSQLVTLLDGRSSTVLRQAEDLALTGEVLAVYGVFAVTDGGIECLDHTYFIENCRLEEDWMSHMGSKNWVNMTDFRKALEYAKTVREKS